MSLYTAIPSDGLAWVTGASSGIGKAATVKLADAGWTVLATARNESELSALARSYDGPGTILPAPGDVTDQAAMESIVSNGAGNGRPIVLALLNAGLYLPVDGMDPLRSDFEKSVNVNILGTINALLPLIASMRRAGRGQIALVSSVAGYGGLPTSSAYGATKAALINLAESFKFDLDHLNIRIQLVNPGFIDTPATKKNPFPMPFLMPVDAAADRIVSGLSQNRFEIIFPRRFTWLMKAINLLPYRLYFPAVAGVTGWSKKSV